MLIKILIATLRTALEGYVSGLGSANFSSVDNVGTYENCTNNLYIEKNTDNKLYFNNLLTLYK